MKYFIFIIVFFLSNILQGQNLDQFHKDIEELKNESENFAHRIDELGKNIDDILWFQREEDVAFIDKV